METPVKGFFQPHQSHHLLLNQRNLCKAILIYVMMQGTFVEEKGMLRTVCKQKRGEGRRMPHLQKK